MGLFSRSPLFKLVRRAPRLAQLCLCLQLLRGDTRQTPPVRTAQGTLQEGRLWVLSLVWSPKNQHTWLKAVFSSKLRDAPTSRENLNRNEPRSPVFVQVSYPVLPCELFRPSQAKVGPRCARSPEASRLPSSRTARLVSKHL